MNLLLISPVIVPFFTAALSLVLWGAPALQRWICVAGNVVLLGCSIMLLLRVEELGIQTQQVGNWPAPYGITVVADLFSSIMLAVTAVIGVAVALFAMATVDEGRTRFGFYPLYNLMLMGVCAAFLTGDLFNLYVWFEVLLMASYVLLSLGGERPQVEGALKYVTINLVSSAFFLAAVGLLYGKLGTLNMADLAQRVASAEAATVIVLPAAMLLLLAFGLKAGMFPLFFWLPASYHTPPAAVSAIFGGLLTKVGVYALVRVFTLIFTTETALTHGVILLLSGFTMVTGVLGAAAQFDFRRLLSFHVISQIGYMTMGLAIAGLAVDHDVAVLALAGTIYFIVHNIVVKTNLFLVAGSSNELRDTYDLYKLGGLYAERPVLAVLFLVSAMSLAGIPPLSGFVGKFLLVLAGLRAERYAIVAVALGVSLLTLYSMTKIWAEVFWKPRPQVASEALSPDEARLRVRSYRRTLPPIVLLAVLSIAMGVIAEPLYRLAHRAAEQLANPAEYITAVQSNGS